MRRRTIYPFPLVILLIACVTATQDEPTNTAGISVLEQAVSKNGPAGGGHTSSSINATLNKFGVLEIYSNETKFRLEAVDCVQEITTVRVCRGAKLDVLNNSQRINQTLNLDSVYVDSNATFYRGTLDSSHTKCCQSFVLSDINFDGSEDLFVWSGKEGAYGGPSFEIYLFDPVSHKFTF